MLCKLHHNANACECNQRVSPFCLPNKIQALNAPFRDFSSAVPGSPCPGNPLPKRRLPAALDSSRPMLPYLPSFARAAPSLSNPLLSYLHTPTSESSSKVTSSLKPPRDATSISGFFLRASPSLRNLSSCLSHQLSTRPFLEQTFKKPRLVCTE